MKVNRQFEKEGSLWVPRYEWDRSGERYERYRRRWNERLRMAIGFVGHGQSTASTTAGTSKTITYSPVAGNTLIVFGFGVGVAVSNVTDNATGGSSVYSLLAGPQTNTVTSTCWGTAAGGVKAGVTTITITFASSTRNTCSLVEYSGVKDFGTTVTGTGSSTTPFAALTTQDANNFLVAGLTRQGTSTWSANTGSLRDSQTGAGTTTPGQGTVDNTVASPGSVTCRATISSSGAWAAAGIELRSVLPPFEDDSYNGIGFLKNDFNVTVW